MCVCVCVYVCVCVFKFIYVLVSECDSSLNNNLLVLQVDPV